MVIFVQFLNLSCRTRLAYFQHYILNSFLVSALRSCRRRRALISKHPQYMELEKKGYVIIPDYLSEAVCSETVGLIKSAFAEYPSLIHESEDRRIFGIEQILPIGQRFAQETDLLELGELVNREYTYCAFALAGWLQAGKGGSSGNGWHRDGFFAQYKAMLYLTDVTEDHGPFEILPSSHTLENVVRAAKGASLGYMQHRYTEFEVSEIEAFTGLRRKMLTAPAGSLILFDSSTIHRGHPIKTGERLSLTNYYFPISRDIQQVRKQFAPVLTPNEI